MEKPMTLNFQPDILNLKTGEVFPEIATSDTDTNTDTIQTASAKTDTEKHESER